MAYNSRGVHQGATQIQILEWVFVLKLTMALVVDSKQMQTVSIVKVAGFVFISALRRPFFAPVSGAKVDSRLTFNPFNTWS